MKKFFIFLFGCVMSLVLLFGAGFWLVAANGGMGTLAGVVPQIEFSKEIKEMSILAYIKRAQSVLENFETTPLGEIEDALGVPISEMMAELLGVDPAGLRNSTFDNLPNAIVDSFTIASLEEKFGITLPDMPMFQSEEFRTKPLLEAFDSISEKLNPDVMTVKDLETNFGIVLSDNPIFNDPILANSPVSKLGEALNEVQLSAMLGVVYRADVEKYAATHVATDQKLTEWKTDKRSYAEFIAAGKTGDFDYFDTVEEQTAYIAEYNAAEPKPAADMIEYWSYAIKAEQEAIYNELYPPTPEGEGGGTEPQPAYPAPEGKIFAKPVAPTVAAEGSAAPTESSVLIKRLSVNKLGDMTATGGSDKVIDNIINNSILGEIIEIDPNDTILYSLKDSKISELDEDIKNIALNQIMKVDETTSKAMKFLTSVPMRDEAEPWKKEEGGNYELDAAGNRIPNYVVKKDEAGNDVSDEEGNPVYVFATINSLDQKIKQMVIGDILEDPASGEEPNVILKKVVYSTLASLDKDLTVAIDGTTIGELVKPGAGEAESTILASLKDTKISELNAKMGELTINDVIPKPVDPDAEHAVIRKLRAMNDGAGVLVSEIGVQIGAVVDDMTLGELLTVDDTSSSILVALKDTKIAALDSRIKTLTLTELVGEEALYETKIDGMIDRSKPKGVLGLIDFKNRDTEGHGTTTIANIGENATEAISTASLAELRMVGLLPQSTGDTSDPNYKTAKAVDLMITKDPSTTVYTLPGAIVELMMTTTIGELYAAGLITVEGQMTDMVRALTLQSLLDAALKPSIP